MRLDILDILDILELLIRLASTNANKSSIAENACNKNDKT